MPSVVRLMANGMAEPLADQLGQDNKSGLIGTGGTKATAVQLTGDINFIATCASAGVAAFQLATAEGSPPVIVENDGVSPALVFAAGTTEKINALTAGASFSVTNAKRAIFFPGVDNSVTPPVKRWVVILSA